MMDPIPGTDGRRDGGIVAEGRGDGAQSINRPMDPSQASRLAAFKTSLGDDVLLLRSFGGEEQLSRPFSYQVELSSTDGAVDLGEIVGKAAGIRLDLGRRGTRYFHGFISRASQLPADGAGARYRVEMVPWLWFLTRTSDCRIFQEMTAMDIVEKVFKDLGFTDYKLKTSRTYRTLEYCVQYRETAFNFVSRLLEMEGVTYYFEHTEDKHLLVLADSPSGHAPVEGYEEVIWHPAGRGDQVQERIRDWRVEKQLQPSVYAHKDFDFTKSRVDLEATAAFSEKVPGHEWEIYDYPGEFETLGDGEASASVRVEELGAAQDQAMGSGDVMGLAAGYLFNLVGHPRRDQNAQYMVTRVRHRFEQSDYDTGGVDGGAPYQCEFSAIPAERQFRPARVTPRPVIQGPQTAFVVGKSGEEIWVDKYGRIKVKFHWDRYAKADETASCWIRVSSEWAGKKWGAIHLPRIGQEVIVEFLEGDPDRPIVTGRVYNDAAMPPYALPDNKTKSTIKSNSSKGGGGFNEIRFEDKKGDEQLFIHAEKNQDVRVKNDCFEWIGNNRHLVVKKDQLEKIENNRDEIVGGDHKEKIEKDRHLKVVGKEAKEVGGSHSFTVKGDVIEVFKANHSEQVTSDYFLNADNIVIEGKSNVTIKVGGSSIAIGPDGIAMKTSGTVKIEAGATLDLKATAPLTVQSSAMAEMKSPMTTVKGDGMLTLKGGMVMIN